MIEAVVLKKLGNNYYLIAYENGYLHVSCKDELKLYSIVQIKRSKWNLKNLRTLSILLPQMV